MSVYDKELSFDVYKAAQKRILHVFANHYLVDLAFSGGKDSIALFYVTINTMRKYGIDFKRLSVTFVDEEAIYPDVPKVVEHYRRLTLSLGSKFYWLCLPWRHYNCTNTLRDEDSWTCWDIRAKDKWVRTPPSYALRWHPDFKYGMSYQEFFRAMANKHPKYIQLWGLRASESIQRSAYFHKMAYANKARRGYSYNIIYDWKDTDVWKIIKDNNAVFPQTYMNLWRIGAKLRMSQIFAADTCQSIPHMLKFYPNFYERLQRRCPNIDIVLLYYDTHLFKSDKQNRLHKEVIKEDAQSLKEEIKKAIQDGFKQQKKDKGFRLAVKVWYKVSRLEQCDVKVYKRILKMIGGGDAKGRSMRALYTDLAVSLRLRCEDEESKRNGTANDTQKAK